MNNVTSMDMLLKPTDARGAFAKTTHIAAKARTIVVSNRVPRRHERAASAGGLAVVLNDAISPGDIWFGWSGEVCQDTSDFPKISRRDGVIYAMMDIRKSDYDKYYCGFSNGALWPLFHYRASLVRFDRSDYEAYCVVNRAFAKNLASIILPSDIIWIHDYQLMNVARELRSLGVQNRIGFFMHIPFVPPNLMEIMPNAKQLIEALSACDVVGFQTEGDRQAYLANVESFLSVIPDSDGHYMYDDRVTHVIRAPVGIEAQHFSGIADKSVQTPEWRRLDDSLGDRSLVIGVDRLDYSKGLLLRFDAIAKLLEDYPSNRRRVNFLQIAARSREDVHSYQALRKDLERLVGEINGKYSEFDWTPLRYMTNAVQRNTIAGFYRRARVGLVTPLRDGMNLVAKEYVAAQDRDDPGVLILSKFAGAAEELTEALIVNPYDTDEVATALDTALAMPLEERQVRHEALLAKVRTGTATTFCRKFMKYLKST